MTLPHTVREWFSFAERSVVRFAMIAIGLTLMVIGLALGVTMVMLPLGLVLGFIGVGLTVWGSVGDLPMDT